MTFLQPAETNELRLEAGGGEKAGLLVEKIQTGEKVRSARNQAAAIEREAI